MDSIVVDDLAVPRFTPDVEAIRAAMAEMDGRLDVTSLHEAASNETGLTDFGPLDYRERLDVLLAALDDVAGVSACGRVAFRSQIVQLLANRLLIIDLLRRHPEIHDIDLLPPIVIAGLPRTGTTHLHNLLATHPRLRTLPYWESLEPVPRRPELGVEPDPRRARTDAAVWFMDQAMPRLALMHEMTTDHVHEEIQLLAIDFSTMFFETLAHVPAWQAYYCDHDQTPHYRFLRTLMQVLVFLRGGERWLLKSPQHLEQLPVLNAVFPDARIVLTHRDPSAVVVSLATMISYSARMHLDRVDPVALGRAWADRVELMLRACVRDRDRLPADTSLDIRFDDFMADDLATARLVLEMADVPTTADAEVAMTAYIDGHKRGRLGRIDYQPADVGLDLEELRSRFAFYCERFL